MYRIVILSYSKLMGWELIHQSVLINQNVLYPWLYGSAKEISQIVRIRVNVSSFQNNLFTRVVALFFSNLPIQSFHFLPFSNWISEKHTQRILHEINVLNREGRFPVEEKDEKLHVTEAVLAKLDHMEWKQPAWKTMVFIWLREELCQPTMHLGQQQGGDTRQCVAVTSPIGPFPNDAQLPPRLWLLLSYIWFQRVRLSKEMIKMWKKRKENTNLNEPDKRLSTFVKMSQNDCDC